jgi:tRNA pseudouridine38-40 synthase
MRNIKLTIEYDGTGFNGWQAQKGKSKGLRTIQEEIEKSGKKLFGKKINLISAGRTDAGVHAKAQVANFRTGSILHLNSIKNGLNSIMSRNISVVSVEEVDLKFHARFDSKGKIYKYTIVSGKSRSPLLGRYAAFVPYDLNLAAMKDAAKYLIGKNDFKSFQSSDKHERHSVRTVKMINIISKPPVIEIYIEADGFLYNMARSIAGTLIDVGRGRFSPGKIREILEKRHRPLAGPTAPAKGLCLEKVFY